MTTAKPFGRRGLERPIEPAAPATSRKRSMTIAAGAVVAVGVAYSVAGGIGRPRPGADGLARNGASSQERCEATNSAGAGASAGACQTVRRSGGLVIIPIPSGGHAAAAPSAAGAVASGGASAPAPSGATARGGFSASAHASASGGG